MADKHSRQLFALIFTFASDQQQFVTNDADLFTTGIELNVGGLGPALHKFNWLQPAAVGGACVDPSF